MAARCRRTKTSAAYAKRTWRKSWRFSLERTKPPLNDYGKTKVPTKSLQSSEHEVKQFFRRIPEINQKTCTELLPRWSLSNSNMSDAFTREKIQKTGLEIRTYEQCVSHLEKDLELNGFETSEEIQVNSVTQRATKPNPEKHKLTYHHSKKKPSHYRKQCCNLERTEVQTESTGTSAGKNNSCQTNSKPNNNKNANDSNNINTNNRNGKKPRNVYPPCDTCGKAKNSTETSYFRNNAANRRLPRHTRPTKKSQYQRQDTQSKTNEDVQATAQRLTEKGLVSQQHCNWQIEGQQKILSPIPEVIR